MKQSRSSRAAWLTASVALLGLAAPLSVSPPAAAAPSPPALHWSRCAGDGLDARQQCASLKVPMDYADPGGRTIDIAVSRGSRTSSAQCSVCKTRTLSSARSAVRYCLSRITNVAMPTLFAWLRAARSSS
jgi:hypothetical protein